jgi:hypothetical protein
MISHRYAKAIKNKKRTFESTTSTDSTISSETPTEPMEEIKLVGTIPEYFSSVQSHIADKTVANFIYQLGLPFHIVETKCFSNFVNAIRQTSKSWKPPSRRMIAGRLLNEIDSEITKFNEDIRSTASEKKLKFTIISDSATIEGVPLTNLISYIPGTGYQFINYENGNEWLQEERQAERN